MRPLTYQNEPKLLRLDLRPTDKYCGWTLLANILVPKASVFLECYKFTPNVADTAELNSTNFESLSRKIRAELIFKIVLRNQNETRPYKIILISLTWLLKKCLKNAKCHWKKMCSKTCTKLPLIHLHTSFYTNHFHFHWLQQMSGQADSEALQWTICPLREAVSAVMTR